MKSTYLWLMSLILLTTLACSAPASLLNEPLPTPRPTRTPLPTFTPSPVAAEVAVVIPPTATDTPLPTATNSPEPTATEVLPTNTPEPTSEPPTDTPEPTPTDPPPAPQPAQQEAPPPAPTDPPPPSGPVASARGVIGTLTFRDGRNTYGVGEQVFVNIEAKNTSGNPLSFGILGLNTSQGLFQTSWDNSSIAAGQTFTHIDGVPFSAPGNHKIWLSVCYSDKTTCQGADGEWERYEPGIDVVIQ